VRKQFIEEFVAETESITVGDPFAEGSDIGPLQNERHLMEIQSLVDDATAKGATLAAGGRRLSEKGYFYAPTVLTKVPVDADVRTVEPFGPIAVIEEYADVREAMKEANALAVGLSAYGFTASGSVANYLATHLESGNIILNNWNSSFPETPFGGVGDSGFGREGGPEGLQEFLTTVLVSQEFANVANLSSSD
jgi:succinate-semialdehyde dehydrogenase / glutarate-semialdehyde dehydrogenase